MKRWKQVLLVGIAVVAMAVGVGLVSMSAVARERGVSKVPVPQGTMIARTLVDADYSDAYAVAVPPQLFANVAELTGYAFQKAESAAETENEVMYVGGSSHLTYHISYLLTKREGARATVTVATAVHYESWRGRLYFTLVRPFHRVITPFMVGRMVERAKAEASAD